MADYFISGYEFEVQLGIALSVSFSKVRNLSYQGDVEVLADGGDNERMYFAAKQRRHPDRTVFERGWQTGLTSMIMSYLTPGLTIKGILILVKRNGSLKKTFYIEEGIISRVTFSDLDALNSNIIIKSMELVHTGVTEYGI